MSAGPITAAAYTSLSHDDRFQRLLLQLSEAAATSAPDYLLRFFCRATREFFAIDGTYVWRLVSAEELAGEEADGWMAAEFRGLRLGTTESAITAQAIRQRKTVYVNNPDRMVCSMVNEFHAKSVMSAPLVVANEVIGAFAFLHCSNKSFFNDDLVSKVTMLAGQLGSLLEASRGKQLSREENRRGETLVEMAQQVSVLPDAASVAQAVADHLRVLLRTRLVSILTRQGESTGVTAISAESPSLAAAVRAGYDRRGLQFAAGLAQRAIAAGEPVMVATDPGAQNLDDLVPAGILLAAPLHTSLGEGAVLIYPRAGGTFTAEEKSLVSAVVRFASVAVGHAELNRASRTQAQELHHLLEILSELNSARRLEDFLPLFVVRAAGFLGFHRAFVGLLEGKEFHVRWECADGQSTEVDAILSDGPLSRALLNHETLCTDDATQLGRPDSEILQRFEARQLLAVPLQGSDSHVFGVLGLLDCVDGAGISRENIRSAQALAVQAAVALEAMRNLHLSRQHAQRADSLMRLAVQLNSTRSLPEFYESLIRCASELMGSQAAALVMSQDSAAETVALYEANMPEGRSGAFLRSFTRGVAEVIRQRSEPVISSTALELLGPDLASVLQWNDFTVIRLADGNRQFLGALCLANLGRVLSSEDEALLQAIAAYASTALENSCQFARMDRANRHWMEIFDAITDFIVAHDVSDNVLRVNRPLAGFIGVQPQELIGVNMGALLASGDETPPRSCPFCQPAREGASHERVHRVLDRIYLVTTSRVHEASGEGLQTVHVLKDITDRREAERRYRELFDNIQEGVFFSTPDGRFVEVNDALVRMLGYHSREELLQADVRTQVCLVSDRYDELVEQMQRHGSVRNHEQTLRRLDGSLIHVLINAFAVRDEHQRTVQYRGVMLDISGLKAFQAELQRERDFSGKILNNTQSLILVADTTGLISYANRRWQDMGYEQAQLLGRPLEELVAPARHKALSEGLAQTLAGQQVDNLELHLVRGEGKVGHFSVNLSPMRDEDGEVSSIVLVMSDVTDVATIQAKLVHTERMAAVGQLVSGVAHEVNNPLTAILGFTDLLMENPEVPESARKDLRVILQEAQRTKQIVQNLLSFARPMPSQHKPVQLNSIIRRTVQLRAYDLHSHGVEILDDLDEHLPPVVGDSHQLQQVFLNIINNAYDAVRDTGRAPRIIIKTESVGKFVEVQFRDNGPGVSFPDRIFDPFFTTKEIGKGTGLGLSICYGIVHAHGGEILCHKNQEEEGATFVVRLPAIAPELSADVSYEGEEP